MPITLENSLKNRQIILENVKEEMIGPGKIRSNFIKLNPESTSVFESKEELYKPYYWEFAGKKEEILQRETPTQRYVCAQLFPINMDYEEELLFETPFYDNTNDDQQLDSKLENIFSTDQDLQSTEEEGDIELFPQKSDFLPSTMGLTFCIDKNVPSLEVLIQGGNYTPHYVKVKGEEKAYTWWLRTSVFGKWDLSILDLAKNKNLKKNVNIYNFNNEVIEYYNIQFQARLREFEDKYIITISVTNRSNTTTINRQMQILFQAELKISTPRNFKFSTYPKPYQMKNILSEDEASIELLYRNEKIYAFGHGCAVNWNQHEDNICEISTTFMPEYETISMTPNITVKKGEAEVELKIKMSDLAGLSSNEHPEKFLKPIVDNYENWIKKKETEIPNLPKVLQNIGLKHVNLCKESLKRMKKGLKLLHDIKVLEAFRLTNKAMLLQQVHGKNKRHGYIEDNKIFFEKSFEDVVFNMSEIKNLDNSWRAFQIAFILSSLESFVNENSEDREIVDLIWFPTGGGKTEAYLGVAAFQIIYRRLKKPNDAGVDIIMRYTLRLLTADQFQRASRLVCALEFLRKTSNVNLGDQPFTIGIWVGSKTTPNSNEIAKKMLMNLQKNDKTLQQFIVNSCPWCGANLGYYEEKKNHKKHYLGFKLVNNQLVIHCTDNKCPFFNELPIYIVDETIYKKRPTFLIGTVDKFVQLIWQPDARSLFGIDKNGNRFVNPPSLIIQDELHLISGPLGTLTGLFETLIEELCLKEINGKIIKPKIIAATATIKQFEEQVLALFGRKKSRLFPSPGLESEDSFFATPAINIQTGKPMPGRKYVGVYPSTVRLMMAQVMVFSSILQGVTEISPDERDPYWTLLVFYNTLRELGGGLTITQTDIAQYSRAICLRKGQIKDMRHLKNVLELTSRKQSHEISKIINDLKVNYDVKKENGFENVLDMCLASNIIEVGVDIDRLSVMAIVGQPKMTAQYIQVSGRVGRRWWERPGLIFTLYSNTKSRDKSHFEHFREYHQKLYAQVEPTSVTPFSDSSLERGLYGVIVGYLRQALNENIAKSPNWNEISKFLKNKILPFYNRLLDRVLLVDPDQVKEFKTRFLQVLKRIENGNYNSWKVDSKSDGFMYPAGTNPPIVLKNRAVSMINSMRNVDAECRGMILPIYMSQDYDSKDVSWEDLFT